MLFGLHEAVFILTLKYSLLKLLSQSVAHYLLFGVSERNGADPLCKPKVLDFWELAIFLTFWLKQSYCEFLHDLTPAFQSVKLMLNHIFFF